MKKLILLAVLASLSGGSQAFADVVPFDDPADRKPTPAPIEEQKKVQKIKAKQETKKVEKQQKAQGNNAEKKSAK